MEIDLSFLGGTFENITANTFFGGLALFFPASIVFIFIFYKTIKKVRPLWYLMMSFFCGLFLAFLIGVFPIAFMAGFFQIEKSKILISIAILFIGYFIFSFSYLLKIKQFILESPTIFKNTKYND